MFQKSESRSRFWFFLPNYAVIVLEASRKGDCKLVKFSRNFMQGFLKGNFLVSKSQFCTNIMRYEHYSQSFYSLITALHFNELFITIMQSIVLTCSWFLVNALTKPRRVTCHYLTNGSFNEKSAQFRDGRVTELKIENQKIHKYCGTLICWRHTCRRVSVRTIIIYPLLCFLCGITTPHS